MRRSQKITQSLLLFLLAFMVIFASLDIISDYQQSDNFFHLITEIILTLIASYALFLTYIEFNMKLKSIKKLEFYRENLHQELNELKSHTQLIRNRLRPVFIKQFQEWQLTPAESEVAFLILRGYTFKQIASLQKKSERTARTQAISIYEKSGFRDRSGFSGFFIESIFDLGDETSFYDE